MDPLFITRFSGKTYEGYLVVDSIYRNRSAGGVRIASDLEPEEVCDLAREMSLKYAFFGLPRGGAKAGIRLPADIEGGARHAALGDFGRRLEPFIRGGIYYPGMDMNCSPDDLRRIYKGAGIDIGTPTDSSWFTALSVASSLASMADALGGRPISLGVEGFGRVAGHLARLLPADRFRIVALSTVMGGVTNPQGWDPILLARTRDEHGDGCVRILPGDRVALDEVCSFPVDIFLPGSRTRSLDLSRTERLRARAVVPIANAAYAEGVIDRLQARGIVALPGYLVNGGGVLGSSLFDRGIDRSEVQRVFDRLHRPLVARILAAASRSGNSPVRIADAVAEERLEARAREAPRSSWTSVVDRRLGRRYPRGVKRALARRACAGTFSALNAAVAAQEHP